MKEYSFWQKVSRRPHKEHCLHAKRFCIKIINYLYGHAVFFAIGLIIMIIECFVSEKSSVPQLPQNEEKVLISQYFFLLVGVARFELAAS